MRVIVYGPGAIGGGIGGLLASKGNEVVLIARGAHLEAIRERGLEIRSTAGSQLVHPEAVASPAELDFQPDDVVILAMKSQDTHEAVVALSRVAPPDLAVVCAQNGVANEREALRHFRRVYGLCVLMPATHLEPGIVLLNAWPVAGILDLGRYPQGVDATATELAARLEGAGFHSLAHPNIMSRKYRKLLGNLGNALDAALGSRDRQAALLEEARDEGRRALAAAGIEIGGDEEDAERRKGMTSARLPESPRGSSSWQSLARGTGSIEADYLNGEIVLLGRLHGIPTPVNEMLQRVANELAGRGAPPGSLEPADLDAALAELAGAATDGGPP